MSNNLLSVVWYDEYDYAHNSQVFGIKNCIDSDYFLIADEDKKIRWVPIDNCELTE